MFDMPRIAKEYERQVAAAQHIQVGWQRHRRRMEEREEEREQQRRQRQQATKAKPRASHSRVMTNFPNSPEAAAPSASPGALNASLLEQIVSKLDRLDVRLASVEKAQHEIADNVKPLPSNFLSVHTETVENNRRVESLSEATALAGGGATFLALNQSLAEAATAESLTEKPWCVCSSHMPAFSVCMHAMPSLSRFLPS